MLDVQLKDITTDQALALADGLALGGFLDMAATLCRHAVDREPNLLARYRLRVRMGLFKNPTGQTGNQIRMLQELESKNSLVFVGEGLVTWLRTLPFLEDDRFMTLADELQELLPIPNWHWNLQTVVWAVQQTAGIEGDLVELGVFKGHTTRFVADYVGFQDSPKRWWLFDTFEGIPADQLDEGWKEVNEAVYGGTFSHAEVSERFRGFPNIEVIKGRVPEILHERCPEKISFLHMDLNNSTAEIAAQEVVFDRLSPGAVIVFDDYCWAASRAQYLAERRWFEVRGLHILPLPTGQGIFVKA